MSTTKKRYSISKLLLSAVLMAVLYLSMALPAFGADVPTGSESSPAEAAITKLLQAPAGTDTPSADFTFAFEKVSVNGDTEAEDLADMPTIANKTVSFTATDAGTTDAGVKSVPKESGNIVAGITWPHAGEYIYEVSETANTYTIADAFNEKMTYSPAVYKIFVYVQEGESGGYFVYAVSATIMTKDASNEASAIGEKVDVTPGGENGEGYSSLIFTNTYVKNNGSENPTKPDDEMDMLNGNTLSVSKKVAGTFANKEQYFTYNVKVEEPTIAISGMITAHKAYIVDEDGAILTDISANSASASTDANGEAMITFVPGTEQTVNLKHGQTLAFADLYVGSTFTVSEAATQGYTPSYIITQNGTPEASVAASESMAIAMGQAEFVGEAKNAADFTNTFRNVTPTGISVDNLPFIALIVIAIGALVGYIVFKTRRSKAMQGR